MPDYDAADTRLLRVIQRDASLTLEALAEKTGLSPSQCSRRLQRLKAEGTIHQTVAILDPAKLGLGVGAFALVSLSTHDDEALEAFRSRVLRLPEVLECAKVTGSADYLLKFRAADLASYDQLLTDNLLRAPEVSHVQSLIVLQELKSTTALPVAPATPARAAGSRP